MSKLHLENADYLNKTDEEIYQYLIDNDPGLAKFSEEEIRQLIEPIKRIAREMES